MRRRGRYRSPYRRWALIGAVGAAIVVLVLALMFGVPLYPGWIVGLSVVLFLMYGFDKRRAVAGGARIPEAVLHGLALAGGFPGGWAGRTTFRHKTRDRGFLIVLLLSTAIHLAIAVWLWV